MLRSGRTSIWLEKFPTDSLVSDQKVVFLDYVEVAGTRDYTTPAGAKRIIWILRALTEEDAKKHTDADALQSARAEESKERAIRTWKGINGSEIKATYGKFNSPLIELF